MGKKRNKKKQRMKIIRSVITLCIVILLGLFSIILKPWENLGQNADVGNTDNLDPNQLQVHYIDVGQADAILIRVPTENGMQNVLIDAGTATGYPAKTITEYLGNLGIETISYMIITHPHLDHAGAADEVIEEFQVENLILSEFTSEHTGKAFWKNMFEAMDAKNLEYTTGEIGDTYQIGEASFEILGPVDPSKVKDTNDYSLVIRMDYGETSFLFTGDAEEASEKEMLKANASSKFKCDVLKVGHHGSDSSTSEAFLAAANPALAIIQCGEGNDYGHPKPSILERLTNANVEILRTDLEGTIIVCSDKQEVKRYTPSN